MSSEGGSHWLSNKHIIVSGAGISGLAFAISLHKLWPTNVAPPSITLYERDPSAAPPGREGYSLSLRSDRPSAGIQTLQKMTMLDALLDVSISSLGSPSTPNRPESPEGGFVFWDKDFHPIVKLRSKTPPNLPISSMRISRASLRRTLVSTASSLPGVSIHWSSTITNAHPSPSGDIDVHLKDGTTAPCTLLLAADGSSSKLRTLLRPRDRLRFAGPTCIFGTAPLSLSPSPSPSEFGSVISGSGTALFVAPIDDSRLVWSLSWHSSVPSLPQKQPLSREESAALRTEAKTRGAAFGQRFADMLERTEEGSFARFNAQDKDGFAHAGNYVTAPEYVGLEGRVVFLGDANHAVSPFAGNGANLALMDGWDFAEALVGEREGLEGAVGRYDGLAVGRARKVVRMSRRSIRVMHSVGWRLMVYVMVLRVVKALFFQ
ncbi:putative monooxygenase [Polyplosphaeria fusca]|uniref:Monooxygenase n=1 Tax=Polyplosphaeria fusca TaxID=682080 RepID=A0A9P4QMR4_9PLEO|nr:putative monooxygenase [Polyplosphaeria fusca]